MSDDDDQELLDLLRQHLGLNGPNASDPPDTGVLRDAQFIYDNSIDVAIDMLGTRRAAEIVFSQMQKREYSTKTWGQHKLHARIKTRRPDEWPTFTPKSHVEEMSSNDSSTVRSLQSDQSIKDASVDAPLEGAPIDDALLNGPPVDDTPIDDGTRINIGLAPDATVHDLIEPDDAGTISSVSVASQTLPDLSLDEQASTETPQNESILNFIFTMDLLNFSFWPDSALSEDPQIRTKHASINIQTSKRATQYTVEHDGISYTGYWSLVAALHRALDEGIPITTPSYWNDSNSCTNLILQNVFRSSTEHPLPLLTERINILRSAAKILDSHYEMSVPQLVAEAKQSAARLVNMLASDFDCFRDETRFEGKLVRFQKRAQIFVADLWACFEGESHGEFVDIDTALTTFPDYRIPQILHTLGCIQYSPPLEAKIRKGVEIPSGSSFEVEIRGCSVWGVELIRKEILRHHPEAEINAVLMDFFLYDWMKEIERERDDEQNEVNAEGGRLAMDVLQHHRTRSIWY